MHALVGMLMQVQKGAASQKCQIMTAQQIGWDGVLSGGWVAAFGLARELDYFWVTAQGLLL